MRTLVFDTATTGRWQFRQEDASPAQPHIARLAYMVLDNGEAMADESTLVCPEPGWTYEPDAVAQHGISPELATERGADVRSVWRAFASQLRQADVLVAFNTDFHIRVLEKTCLDATGERLLADDNLTIVCAMRQATDLVQKPRPGTHSWAWPKLVEAYHFFTGMDVPKCLDPIDQGHVQTSAVLDIWRGILDAHPKYAAA